MKDVRYTLRESRTGESIAVQGPVGAEAGREVTSGRIKAAGFVELEVGFFPEGGNDPTKWTTFSADYYQENWSLIQNLRPIIAGAGIPYHIDLSNEGIPPAGFAAFLQYSQELWNDYVSMFGNIDTIGFSIIADASHIGQVSVVYGPSPYGNHGSPQRFDVHIYNDAASSFESAFNALNAQGYQGIPWVIGEAFYNDAMEASALRQAANSMGQKVLYLTEWPETADQSCDPNVNVAPPLNFSNYRPKLSKTADKMSHLVEVVCNSFIKSRHCCSSAFPLQASL